MSDLSSEKPGGLGRATGVCRAGGSWKCLAKWGKRAGLSTIKKERKKTSELYVQHRSCREPGSGSLV